jgi:TRAP-type C4-dicarboxylate transport system substrate-binding protein
MKRLLILSIAVLVAGLFQQAQVSWAQSKKPMKLKWNALEPLGGYELNAFQKVADIVEKKTKGRIKIEIFSGAALGGRKATLEGLKMGTIDLFGISLTTLARYDPERLKICGLLYGFRDRTHHRAFLKSPMFKKSEEVFVKNGWRVLSTEWNWDRGPYRTFVSRKPVFVPDDIQGMKMRIWPAEIPRMSWLGMGASPIVIEIAEAYMALKQGIADAVTIPITQIWAQKFTEVLKYVTVLDQFPQTIPVLMSEKTWPKLTPADQKIFVDAVTEGG